MLPKEIVKINEVRLWIEDSSSIHIKAVSSGDPVELNEDEASELADVLNRFVKQIADDDSQSQARYGKS
jgi:hypothetical protein